MGLITKNSKLSDIMLANHLLILPLEHFSINLGSAEKTVGEVCKEHKINESLFLSILNLFNGIHSGISEELSFGDLKVIIKYLKNCHKYYLDEKCPQIYKYIQDEILLNNNSEMSLVEKFFDDYLSEVKNHLNYENDVVFPYIERTIDLFESNDSKNISDYSVLDYKDNHFDIEDKLADLKNLLIKYLPINNDQQIRRKLLFELFEFESDLNIHSTIEETVLIPIVEKMENVLKAYNV